MAGDERFYRTRQLSKWLLLNKWEAALKPDYDSEAIGTGDIAADQTRNPKCPNEVSIALASLTQCHW